MFGRNPKLPYTLKLPNDFATKNEDDTVSLREDIQSWMSSIQGKWEVIQRGHSVMLSSATMKMVARLTAANGAAAPVNNSAIILEMFISFESKTDAALFKTFWL